MAPRVKAVNCPAIDGIIQEADEVAGEVEDKSVLDAALINAAQAAEHYEITRYGRLIAWARQLGRNDCAGVLQKMLDEEKAADKNLTKLAEAKVIFGLPADFRMNEAKRRAEDFFRAAFGRRRSGCDRHSSIISEAFCRNEGLRPALVPITEVHMNRGAHAKPLFEVLHRGAVSYTHLTLPTIYSV